MRALSVAAVFATYLAVASSPALGQEEGVTLDPGDPAAKEYALPHEEARREASGDAKAPVTPGTRDSAAFGEGIGADRQSTDSDTPKQPPSKRSSPSTDDGTSAPTPETTPPPTTPAAIKAGLDDDAGPSATTALIGGGIAVVLVALLGGFGLRAVRGPHD